MNRKSVGCLFSGVVVLLLLGTARVWAYTPGACNQDAEKLCPGLTGKELTPCLKQNQDKLSDACKVNLAEGREMVRQFQEACKADIQNFCADVKTGEGRIRKCLKAHEPGLTPECRDKIAEVKKKIQTGVSN